MTILLIMECLKLFEKKWRAIYGQFTAHKNAHNLGWQKRVIIKKEYNCVAIPNFAISITVDTV